MLLELLVNSILHIQIIGRPISELNVQIHLFITFTEVAERVLDSCVVRNPAEANPKSQTFEVAFDYSFVEDGVKTAEIR